jgi:hypothetical protein
MHHRPFPNQIQSPAWQLAFEDLQGADFNRGFEFVVSGVKMRWRLAGSGQPRERAQVDQPGWFKFGSGTAACV